MTARCHFFSLTILGVVALNGVTSRVYASEYGVSTYRPGLMDLYAGLLPSPGTLIVKDLFLFQDASARAVTENRAIEANTDTTTYTDAIFLGYVTPVPLLGTHWAVGTIQMARIASQVAHIGPLGARLAESKLTVGGLGDGIFIPGMLSWDFGQFHLLTAFCFYAPTGNYDPHRIISTGVNRWAFEPDIGFTWLNDSGQEESVFVGYTMNTKNKATDYHSGDEFHTDFALVQHFQERFLFGVAGYALQQTTADGGSGATLGRFKGRVIGLGPIFGYALGLGSEIAVNLTAKYDFEFADQNRSSGNELWLTGSIQF